MENEIKVNEYIRTKRGIIDKAVKILDDYIFLESKFFITEYGESFTFIKKTDVVKHSSNLIDLIQYGDYVNGEQITDIWNGNRVSSIKSNFNEEDIKTIVTKEMMESISYKVKE